jgi:glutathione S-transferase
VSGPGSSSAIVRSLQHRAAQTLGVDESHRADTVITMLTNNRRRAPGYWIQLLLAMGIATLGLVLNSIAVVIGAMLVSPLMGPIVELGMAMLFERDKSWYAERLPMLQDRVRVRLGELSRRLGDADWLDGAFSAGDLMIVTVLRRLNASGLLDEYPEIAAYVARGEARPAFRRAFDAQLAVFTGASRS